MRRIFLLLTMMAATLVVASGVSPAATPGDPDRPLAVDRVYNPRVVALAATSGDTFSLGSNSSWSKGQTGGGTNEIRFEDTPGVEGQTVAFLKIKGIDGESDPRGR